MNFDALSNPAIYVGLYLTVYLFVMTMLWSNNSVFNLSVKALGWSLGAVTLISTAILFTGNNVFENINYTMVYCVGLFLFGCISLTFSSGPFWQVTAMRASIVISLVFAAVGIAFGIMPEPPLPV